VERGCGRVSGAPGGSWRLEERLGGGCEPCGRGLRVSVDSCRKWVGRGAPGAAGPVTLEPRGPKIPESGAGGAGWPVVGGRGRGPAPMAPRPREYGCAMSPQRAAADAARGRRRRGARAGRGSRPRDLAALGPRLPLASRRVARSHAARSCHPPAPAPPPNLGRPPLHYTAGGALRAAACPGGEEVGNGGGRVGARPAQPGGHASTRRTAGPTHLPAAARGHIRGGKLQGPAPPLLPAPMGGACRPQQSREAAQMGCGPGPCLAARQGVGLGRRTWTASTSASASGASGGAAAAASSSASCAAPVAPTTADATSGRLSTKLRGWRGRGGRDGAGAAGRRRGVGAPC
jgi:hypothetical protein